VQDLSHLAENSLTATSQGAGNMMSSNATAMTAPGSQPVTPLPPTRDQDTPNLTMTAEIAPGTSGKPQASGQAHRPEPPRPSWGKAEPPDVTRIPAPVPPEPTGDAAQVSIGVAGPARGATSGKPAGARAAAASTINAVPGGSDS